jgi:hypothetical protein
MPPRRPICECEVHDTHASKESARLGTAPSGAPQASLRRMRAELSIMQVSCHLTCTRPCALPARTFGGQRWIFGLDSALPESRCCGAAVLRWREDEVYISVRGWRRLDDAVDADRQQTVSTSSSNSITSLHKSTAFLLKSNVKHHTQCRAPRSLSSAPAQLVCSRLSLLPSSPTFPQAVY